MTSSGKALARFTGLVAGGVLAVAMFMSGPVAGGHGKPTARVAVTVAAGSGGLAVAPAGQILAAELEPGDGFGTARAQLRVSNPGLQPVGARLRVRVAGRQLDDSVELRVRSGRRLFSGYLASLRETDVRPLVIAPGRRVTVEVAARLRPDAVGWQDRAARIAVAVDQAAAP